MEIIATNDSLSARESPLEEKTYKIYIIEGVAWTGSALILTAYIGSLERTTDFLFNTLGAAGVLGVCIKKRAFQPIVLNAAWIIGGCYKYFLTDS
jgi:hypothetical protein